MYFVFWVALSVCSKREFVWGMEVLKPSASCRAKKYGWCTFNLEHASEPGQCENCFLTIKEVQ